MAGFQFSLKGKVNKPNAAKGLLKVGAKKNVLGDTVKEERIKTSIDGFNSKDGALSGELAVAKDTPLIIRPVTLSTGLIKSGKAATSAEGTSEPGSKDDLDAKARQSILSGELLSESGTAVIEMARSEEALENTNEDYEDVPVDQFGAALLRGMGWTGEKSKNDTGELLAHRQQGAVLGIGSKPVEKELEQDLMGRRAKLTAPLIQRPRP